VDLEAGALRVRRALAQTNDGPVLTAPKGAKSRRRIKLTGAAVEALKRHKAAQNAERLRFGGLWEDRGLVFPNRTGRFHDLRHTCATILLSRGVHAKLVQELLGHATISITLDTYSHVLPGMDDGLADAMGMRSDSGK